MKCPLQTEETPVVLLDYAAGRLEGARRLKLERHLAGCARCEAFRAEQAEVWDLLDAWEPPAVSTGFNRVLWRRIDEAAAAPWHRKLAEALRFGAWKPAFPIAAAAMVIVAGFVFDHRTESRPGSGPSEAAAGQISTPNSGMEADQVEKTLDDIQLLRQFDAVSSIRSKPI